MNAHPNSPRTPQNTTNGRKIKRNPATAQAMGKQNRLPSLASPTLSPISTPNGLGVQGGRGKKKGPTQQNGKLGIPTGPTPIDEDHDGFHQRQLDELEAIKSIFADAVETLEKPGAWNVSQ